MPRSDDILRLPPDLPVPVDDGMARHLTGLRVAVLALPSTSGEPIDLSALTGRTVVYCYPRTGRPDQELPAFRAFLDDLGYPFTAESDNPAYRFFLG